MTLGCRLNQYETQSMREDVLRRGYAEAGKRDVADIYVINTCTVTEDADRDSRYLIRKCHRENPNAKVIVTGCYVERDAKTVESIPGVTRILFNRQKSELGNLLDSCTGLTMDLPLRSKADYAPLSISEFSGKDARISKSKTAAITPVLFAKLSLSGVVREAVRCRKLLKRRRDCGIRVIAKSFSRESNSVLTVSTLKERSVWWKCLRPVPGLKVSNGCD